MHGAHVFVNGEGIAALTAAYLLASEGVTISVRQETAFARPILMLPENTVWLINDIWDLSTGQWSQAYPISLKKVFAEEVSPEVFPYKACSIVQDRLQQTMKEKLKARFPSVNWLSPDEAEGAEEYDWRINAIAKGNAYTNFGTRRLTSFLFDYDASDGPNDYCQMIRTATAWYFMFPVSETTGCLQVMHSPDRTPNFSDSARLVRRLSGLSISRAKNDDNITFSAFPRLADKFYDQKEIVIGQSLVRYDPMAGDGTGNAIRSAAWAARIISKSLRGEEVANLLHCFKSSVTQHFRRHLTACQHYYATPFH